MSFGLVSTKQAVPCCMNTDWRVHITGPSGDLNDRGQQKTIVVGRHTHIHGRLLFLNYLLGPCSEPVLRLDGLHHPEVAHAPHGHLRHNLQKQKAPPSLKSQKTPTFLKLKKNVYLHYCRTRGGNVSRRGVTENKTCTTATILSVRRRYGQTSTGRPTEQCHRLES